MILYVVIYCFLLIIAVICGYKIKKLSVLSLLSLILIVCFQGFRWRTGSDWTPYLDCFEISNKTQASYVEYGYYLFNRVIRYFTNSYTVFLLIECTLIACCQWIFAKQFNINNISAVLLYFFSITIFPVRFTLASSIFLLSYKYIQDRNLIKFLFTYILASSIHQIIALTLPLYFFSAKEYSAKILLIIYIVCCGIGFMTEIVFKNVTDTLALIFTFLPAFSQDKALAYMKQFEESSPILASISSYINGGVFICVFLFIRNKISFSNNSYNVLLNIYVFGLSFSRLFLNTIPYLARINMCCTGGFILMLLLGLQKTKPNYRWCLTSILFIYLMFSYINKIDSYLDLYIPYYSILSPVKRLYVY